jgi:hypothetical protein
MQSSGCCENYSVYIKVNTDQNDNVDILAPSISIKSIIPIAFFVVNLFTPQNEQADVIPKYHSPPLVFEHPPLYILHSILTI